MRWHRRLIEEEDGQALIWGAGVLVLLVALFYGAMDLGQLVLGKIQAQNAADAAALSASSLKASVHNTRSLAYRATTGQIHLTRLQLVKATGLAINEIAKPGGANASEFQKSLKRAAGHRNKVERLRTGLIAFNQWVTGPQAGARLVQQAAEYGYLGNMGTLATADRQNLHLLAEGTDSLAEHNRSFGNKIIGNVTYTGEALSEGGHAGKSLVRIEPKITAFGGRWLDYQTSSPMSAEAAAGPVPARELYGKTLAAIAPYGIEWYTVRLMPIGVDPARKKR